MADENQEINRRTVAFRQQQSEAREAAFQDIVDKERRARERKTALLRERRSYGAIGRIGSEAHAVHKASSKALRSISKCHDSADR